MSLNCRLDLPNGNFWDLITRQQSERCCFAPGSYDHLHQGNKPRGCLGESGQRSSDTSSQTASERLNRALKLLAEQPRKVHKFALEFYGQQRTDLYARKANNETENKRRSEQTSSVTGGRDPVVGFA